MSPYRSNSHPEVDLRPGRITSLDTQKKNRNRVSLCLDGTFVAGLYSGVVQRFGLFVGQELSVQDQRALLDAEYAEHARQVAIRFLAHKPRTTREIRDRLHRDGYASDLVESIVDDMVERKWLDDEAYAIAYVENRVANKGYGPKRIRQELKRRGVEDHVIEQALADGLEEHDVSNIAYQVAARRWRQIESENDMRKRSKRLLDYLVRRGFSYELSREIMERISAEEGNQE